MIRRPLRRPHALFAAMVAVGLMAGCSPQPLAVAQQPSQVPAAAGAGSFKSSTLSLTAPYTPPLSGGVSLPTQIPPVYVVIFTHIEDNTPAGTLGTATSRSSYLHWRGQLIEMATLARRYNLTWVLQPDWKFLVAALQYENAAIMATTGGKNILRYLRDDMGVPIDPHAHESGAYNYTDVADLLTQLGVGGSVVIGGHIWDPTLPSFAHWERFRVPVAGSYFPTATWRGRILMGHGTPNHVNDPVVSGVWRPQDPNHFFVDDPTANITAVGSYRSDIPGISALVNRYRTGLTSPSAMLTSTYHITPAMITSASALSNLETTVLMPLQNLVLSRQAEVTDFTRLVATWQTRFAGSAYLYQE